MKGKKSDSRSAGKRGAETALRSDVIVIGSGVVGAACAAALARKGRRVRVLSMPGRSTTAVSGGHLLLQSKQPGRVLELARRGLELVGALAAGQEADLGYRQSGSLLLVVTDAEEAALRRQFEALTAADVPLQWLSGEEARGLEPHLSTQVQAATFCPLDAQIDAAALAGSWLQEAVLRRAFVSSGAEVESFVTTAGRITGVVAGGQEFAAPVTVLAAGPWSGELARKAGVELELRPRRGILIRAESAETLAHRPLLGAGYLVAKFGGLPDPPAAFSLQQHPGEEGTGGLCVLGGTREFVEWSQEGVAEAVTAIQAEAARFMPILGTLDWQEPTVGFRPWVPTAPYLGPSAISGLHLACGFEGDGVTLAAAVAEKVAEGV